MLQWYYNKRLSLHTFLPSATEVLPLLLPVSVFIGCLVTMVAAVIVATLMMMDVIAMPLLTPVLIFSDCAVGRMCLRLCGSLTENVSV